MFSSTPKSWFCCQGEGAILHYQRFYQNILAFWYRDILENAEVWHTDGHVDGRGGANRAVTVMRHNWAIVGFCHSRDLAKFVHTTCVDSIRLDIIAAELLQQFPELEACHIALTGGDRRAGTAFQVDEGI